MKTILLIEDDPALLRLAHGVLEAAGYTAEAAADGAAARTRLQSTPYHGIVLDVSVPGGDYALAEEIGALGANRHTPVVILGTDEPMARRRAFDAGAMAFLPKPFTAEAFRSVVQSVISPAGPRPGGPRPAISRPAGGAPATPRPSLARMPGPVEEPPLEASGVPVAEGSLPVSYPGGPVYWCPPDSDGGWRCARCELGSVRSPEVGSTCNICQAAVVAVEAPSGHGLWWLVLLLLLGLIAGWAALTRWE